MAGEAKIEEYLVDEVKRRGGETRKVKWLGRHGAPDRLVWIPAWSCAPWVEVKDQGKNLEAHQRREHKRLNRMGMKTFMVNRKEAVDRLMRMKL